MSKKQRNQNSRVELLLPAQNLKSVKAAIGKADAIYFGTEVLNMRKNADNISIDDIEKITQLCHSNNIKAYLTSNVIVYDYELDYLEDSLKKAKEAQVDAVIVHDMATLEMAKKIGLKFHCSTQMSISNYVAARFYEKLGAQRIILARELSLEQIKGIHSKLKSTELEAFVHGAQCTSISGRCYFSAFCFEDSNKSANRGACLQPCRHHWKITHLPTGNTMDYHEGFFFNSKDLCMIEYIPELIQSGVKSLKVEGRMRDPHYVEVVSQCYREAIDSYYDGSYSQTKADQWLERLNSVYNRGFSTGFYIRRADGRDIDEKNSGNQSLEQKRQIGKVIGYYRNIGVAKIQIHEDNLKIGDEIIIESGSNVGTYISQKIESIKIKNVDSTKTGLATSENQIVFSTIVDNPVKKGDYVYRYN